MTPILQIDLETYSSVDLTKSGVYRYVEAPDFEILLFAYAYDDEDVQVVDLTAFEDLPGQVLHDLTDPNVVKTAYNANFERTSIAKHFGIYCDPLQWRCTAVHALALGLPGYLEGVAGVLKLEAQKDTKGKNLIKYFSVPCKPTKANGGRTRNYPHHDMEKWEEYKAYNRQDVVVEREVRRKLERFPVPAHEWHLWALDQRINDRGVRLDPVLFQQAIACDKQYEARLVQEARDLTGLENPNSLTQLKGWLSDRGLETPDGLSKTHMPVLLDAAPDDETRRVLELRQEMSKTSVDKYNAMSRSMCADERVRGLLQFCGANRTWRWAGRLVQVQNLPQNKVDDLTLARETLRSGDFELLEMLFGPPPFVLSQLIRTAFIPSEGHRFIVSDFSAIEARVIAWLADEYWVLDVFRGHGKIYEATAAQMFKVPFETITKGHANYELRAKGKVATLACGYQGGPNALIAMGALRSGIAEEELPRLVKQWRKANPNIVKLWYAAEEAAVTAVREKTTVKLAHGVQYRYEAGVLFADLPSGRSLAYVNPRIKPDPNFDKDGLVFDGMDQVKKKWMSHRTYGGRLVENLVQAIARDCLAESLMRLDAEGYETVMHVHDEVVLDVPIGKGSLEHVTAVMGNPISWAPGLPLSAAGFECDFYQKD
ncbi:DNA polymerase [Aneurinibacillus aneurinilyticus]|uniref:DNA-directed DNA polymerase n=1 Tax=Aneurinibacillus aneurinilyticus ATCC 12856 TaxID=649747 RepID=U1Y2R1_ANEAE|nr:DNA polymerase [Aneurinibacillus aneurinilyticus]ERI06487.1 DNA polymerase family protein [Aneurinibacillus aneurinilyticus ATCC 12856]MED0707102.1 DNA polymerase [Aneurinibacillus aneurinilyticus]MED0732829.1 DNA polymerase [Aneurinibacillus aneurinilyticus]MED0740401.1 DNA polymerase [Aneurinibacillus aneurinilyticus]